MSLVISNYQLIRESMESEFKLNFSLIQNSQICYTLRYPSNPVLDCQIVNLHEKQINHVVAKLFNLIEEDEFGMSTRIQLIQFKNWIIKIVNLGVNTVDLE